MSAYAGFPLTMNEAKAYLDTGTLPNDFRQRVANYMEFGWCANCGGVHCMHFVMRDWWAPDIDDCDGWCCPDCSNLKPESVEVRG